VWGGASEEVDGGETDGYDAVDTIYCENVSFEEGENTEGGM
jgi:hypothetical protein